MSSGNRSDRSALVVLGLLAGFVVLISLLGLYARHEANYQVGCYTSYEIDQKGIEQHSTICPDDFLYFGDGLAQWVMSIFAVVATGASIVGIVLLRRTFEETKRTADAAFQAIGTERAWMTFFNYEMGPTGIEVNDEPVTTLGYKVTWKNTGRSPANDLHMYTDYRIVFPPDALPEFRPDRDSPERSMRRTHVGAGDTISTQVNVLRPEDAERAAHLVVYCWVEYRDLYSERVRTSEMCSRILMNSRQRPDGTFYREFEVNPVGTQNRLT